MTVSDAAASNVCVLPSSKTCVPVLASFLVTVLLGGLMQWLKGGRSARQFLLVTVQFILVSVFVTCGF